MFFVSRKSHKSHENGCIEDFAFGFVLLQRTKVLAVATDAFISRRLAAASGWKHSVLTPTSKGEATCLCEISEICESLKVIWDLIFRVFREICVR